MNTINFALQFKILWLGRKIGIPNVIILNNGRQFDNPIFRKFCQDLGHIWYIVMIISWE